MNSIISEYGIPLAALAGVLYILYGKRKTKGEKTPTTTHDLIRYKDISADGIVELPNHQYRLVIEVESVNMVLKSHAEQSALWLGFRDLVNALTIPATFLIQSRHLDLKDYISELQNISDKAPTPELCQYGKVHCNDLSDKTEKNVRDRKHYIILKIDALAVSSIDSGIRIENEALNALVQDLLRSRAKQGNTMSQGEIKALARQELENVAGVIQGCLAGMEIPNIRLNREGVMDLIYSSLNRDLAPHARLAEANTQEMFSLITRSLTPYIGGAAQHEHI